MGEGRKSATLGRAEENDVVVKGNLISRVHARVEMSRDKFTLVDESTNGTFVQTNAGEEDLRAPRQHAAHGRGRDRPRARRAAWDRARGPLRDRRRLRPRRSSRAVRVERSVTSRLRAAEECQSPGRGMRREIASFLPLPPVRPNFVALVERRGPRVPSKYCASRGSLLPFGRRGAEVCGPLALGRPSAGGTTRPHAAARPTLRRFAAARLRSEERLQPLTLARGCGCERGRCPRARAAQR